MVLAVKPVSKIEWLVTWLLLAFSRIVLAVLSEEVAYSTVLLLDSLVSQVIAVVLVEASN